MTGEDIVTEALTWIGTPYKHMARVKGTQGGCDCATFLIEAFRAVGALGKVEMPRDDPGDKLRDWYDSEWNLHRSEEKYLEYMMPHADRVIVPEPGDIVMFRMGRTVAHGGIWLGQNRFVHCWNPGGVTITDMQNDFWLASVGGQPRLYGYFRVKGIGNSR